MVPNIWRRLCRPSPCQRRSIMVGRHWLSGLGVCWLETETHSRPTAARMCWTESSARSFSSRLQGVDRRWSAHGSPCGLCCAVCVRSDSISAGATDSLETCDSWGPPLHRQCPDSLRGSLWAAFIRLVSWTCKGVAAKRVVRRDRQ